MATYELTKAVIDTDTKNHTITISITAPHDIWENEDPDDETSLLLNLFKTHVSQALEYYEEESKSQKE